MQRITLLGGALVFTVASIFACSSDDDSAAGEPPVPTCEGDLNSFRWEQGSADGHADPFGAKAAGQARAGRVRDPSMIVQNADSRYKARVDDFVMANDHITAYVEKEGRENGYTTLGGDLLGVDAVGDDGRPKGLSLYGDTAIAFSRQSVQPDKVTVLNDGADGKAAVIRVSGVLVNVPFFDSFAAISQEEYDFPVAYDYVLEPHAEKVVVRISMVNTRLDAVDLGKKQFFGNFQGNVGQLFTEEQGFAKAEGEHPFIAYAGRDYGFVMRSLTGKLRSDLEIQGFQLFTTSGLTIDACAKKTFDYVEIAGGSGGIDGLLEAKRRAFAEPAWHEVHGTLREENGGPLAGAFVHATTSDGKYLTRAPTAADGTYSLHVPNGTAVQLTPTLQGWALPAPTAVAPDATTADLTLPQRATLDVTAKDATTNDAFPVRIQVLPATTVTHAPDAFGLREEATGLWQEFAMDGHAALPVPPGSHRVIVSRGWEYELHDETVTAEAGKTTTITAPLQRSVDTTGVMCADFHVHSNYSLDSRDPFEGKVKSAVADGLEIPVSSEHLYIADFMPVIQRLGITKWATTLTSAELTTFTWGHFGVIPAHLDPNAPNNGATKWMRRNAPEVFAEVNAAAEKPVLVVNHPRSEGFQGYFGVVGFDLAQAKGTDATQWSDAFAALEVANGKSLNEGRDGAVADWFALLNAGKTVWGIGNSDNHDYRFGSVGYPRNCLRFGHDDPTQLTPETIRDVVRAGTNVVSGGISMTVEGPGGIGPGGTATAGSYKITVAVPSWISATMLEVIVDGTTAKMVPLGTSSAPGPGKRWELTVDVQPASSRTRHWVVFNATGDGDLAPIHTGRKPFAFSNPIFF